MAYNNVKVKARQVVAQSSTQTKDLGTVSEVPMGDWNADTPYKKLNKVRYVSTGGSGVTLLAKKANQGVEPFVSQGWQDVWMVENYDGGAVIPNGTYPDMTVGNAMQAENDGTGNNIANQFSEVVSDIQGLREDINTESHFRGMFESAEDLRTAYPTATPNDYAYIVGGNIYIWQNNAWQDSGEPSPNTSVPKGTSTPLMDGVGSAGVANAYAPIDHRHPENTNKLNKSGDTMTGALISQHTNNFISHNDEFNFGDPNGALYYQFRDSTVTEHKFCNGNKELAKVVGKEIYEDTVRVYSPNNPQPVDKLMAYPIGAVYISVSSTSPGSLFGGSWTPITSGYYLRTVTSGSGNYYPAGLPNISGSFECIAYMDNRTGTGALKNTDPTNSSVFVSSGTGTKNNRFAPYSFDANRSNSLYGNSTTVTPQNYTVYMWRRTI